MPERSLSLLALSIAQLLDWVQEGPKLAPFPDNFVACRAASHDLEAHSVRVDEESGVVVIGIFGIELRRRCLDTEGNKSNVSLIDGLAIGSLQAQVVQARRVRVMWPGERAGRIEIWTERLK
jgi:hypothetical protein